MGWAAVAEDDGRQLSRRNRSEETTMTTSKTKPWPTWRKRRGQEIWELREPTPDGGGHVVRYLVERMEIEGDVVLLAKRIGDSHGPEILHQLPVGGELTEAAAKGLAMEACEGHLQQTEPKTAKLSVALDWQETPKAGSGIWEAVADDGGRYTCTEIRGTWRAGYSLTSLVPLWPEQVNLAGAQLLCEQHHAGRGLEWREGVDCWLADDGDERDYYACEPDDDGEQWLATDQSTDTEIGAGTLDEAQALCQIHRGKRLLEAAKAVLPETAKALGLVGERDTKPENPERELREWSIPVALSDDDFDARSRKLAGLVAEIGQNTIEIARVKKDAKDTINDLEEAIGVATKESLELAEIVEARAEHRLVKCLRLVVDGEEIFIDPDNDKELHRAALPDQGQLWGGDRPPPPPADKPPERLTADEAVAELDPGNEQPKLDWKRVRLDGQPAYRAEVPGGEYRVERQATGGPGKGLLVAFWAPTDGELAELRGQHDKVADAKAEAEQHWQSRLLWPGDPASGLLVSRCGKYQLSQCVSGLWAPGYIGGLDDDGEELSEDALDLAAAQAACQAHADAGRAGR